MEAVSLRHTSKPEISSVHHRHTGLPSTLLCTRESQEGDRQRKLERGWGGGFPAGRASGISEWAGRIARLLGSWGVFRMLAASFSSGICPH